MTAQPGPVGVTRSLSEFYASISSPPLQAVASHWLEVRAHNPLPSWNDLRPSALSRHLPIIWSYKYDRASRTFTGRLAGDRIARLFGKNFRGIPLIEAHAPSAISMIHAGLSRVVLEPAAHRGWGNVIQQGGNFGTGERIMLPLASDHRLADEVFGATVYDFPLLDVHAPTMSISEHEEWFSLPG